MNTALNTFLSSPLDAARAPQPSGISLSGDRAPTLPPELERLAQRRAKARLGWYTHACIYVCVISGLVLVGLYQGRAWPLAPALGWGFGLFMHGLSVFALGRGSAWRERLVQRERARLLAQRDSHR